LSRTRRRAVVAANPYYRAPIASPVPVAPPVPPQPTPAPYEPSDEGVRIERLKTLASLRDSGALTQEEFEAEKRRILEGH
jgi:hypothetical protein